MSDLTTKVKTINSAVRTGIAVTILGAVGYGGWFGYTEYVQPGIQAKAAQEELTKLQVQFDEQKTVLTKLKTDFNEQSVVLAETKRQKDKLQTSLKLMKVDERKANIKVMEKGEDENGEPYMLVKFTEVDPAGNIIGVARDFELKGNRLFVDCWVVSFEDHYVESGDALRGRSLCVFKTIFGNIDGPEGSKSLDQSDTNRPPGIYDDSATNEFEQKIWSDFWGVSNDTAKQKELGILASYGDAPNMVVEEGKTYQILVRASGGGPRIQPLDEIE